DEYIITDGSHIKDGKLEPNITYKTGEHDYIYRTNENGLIVNAHADDLQLKLHDGRLSHDPNTLGKEAGDHAGHLFGDRFGGSPELDNLVSQSKEVNLSEFKVIENQWAKALDEGKSVAVDIKVNYDAGSVRPASFDITYIIDGEESFKKIYN
ncbi:MAG: DNA/RNA non-specific endonuclease, partial [Acetatifactor sp.]|nr:DNA/RNA non-specific endonuclease [Acetatifactor sp.]